MYLKTWFGYVDRNQPPSSFHGLNPLEAALWYFWHKPCVVRRLDCQVAPKKARNPRPRKVGFCAHSRAENKGENTRGLSYALFFSVFLPILTGF